MPCGCGLGVFAVCGSDLGNPKGSLGSLPEPLFSVLAKHFVEDNRVQVVASVFGRGVVATSPSSHPHLFDSIHIEGAFLFQDCQRIHDSSSTASRYQTDFRKNPAAIPQGIPHRRWYPGFIGRQLKNPTNASFLRKSCGNRQNWLDAGGCAKCEGRLKRLQTGITKAFPSC